MPPSLRFHYTDDNGFKAIGSQATWVFKTGKPPDRHPVGAYFTALAPETTRLAIRLRIPKRKIAYVFGFVDKGDLTPIDGDRGEYIFFSPVDYAVQVERQIAAGPRADVQERLK